MSPDPATPADRHRRRLRLFARWLAATLDGDDAHRESIVALARRIDAGGMARGEADAAADALDELLAEVWDRKPEESP